MFVTFGWHVSQSALELPPRLGTEDCDGRLNLRAYIARVPHLRPCLEPEMHVHFSI